MARNLGGTTTFDPPAAPPKVDQHEHPINAKIIGHTDDANPRPIYRGEFKELVGREQRKDAEGNLLYRQRANGQRGVPIYDNVFEVETRTFTMEKRKKTNRTVINFHYEESAEEKRARQRERAKKAALDELADLMVDEGLSAQEAAERLRGGDTETEVEPEPLKSDAPRKVQRTNDDGELVAWFDIKLGDAVLNEKALREAEADEYLEQLKQAA